MRLPSWAGALVIMLAGAGIFVLALYLVFAGYAVVHDETGQVVEAAIVNQAGETRLRDLPGGLFYAMPDREGVIEVRCRDGSRGRAGYVTAGMHSSVTVTSAHPCTPRENH